MRVALEEGICDTVLSNLIVTYQERAALLCRTLQGEPRIHISTVPRGGYFVWISFAGIADASRQFLPYCQERGVNFLPGIRCASFVRRQEPKQQQRHVANDDDDDDDDNDDECKRSARLCFADMNVDDIENGAKLLIKCYQEFMASGGEY